MPVDWSWYLRERAIGEVLFDELAEDKRLVAQRREWQEAVGARVLEEQVCPGSKNATACDD